MIIPNMSENHKRDESIISSDNGANWLGFSLSPICFNGGENVGLLQTPLTVLPLKSDGSLCTMEALTRSQQSQVPKLENFLGSSHGRETMALSMDNIQGLYQSEEDGLLLKNWISGGNNISNGGLVGNNNYWGVSSVGYGDLQSLTLSMSPGSHQSTSPGVGCVEAMETKKRGIGKVGPNYKKTVHRKSIDTFGQRTSQYRGVTKHRWTGRYEAHLWDNSCKKEGQTRKGKQVYLGGYDMEEKAARSYDLAALKYWGLSTHTNFPIENYKEEIEEMKPMTRQEYVAHLRRKSSGFSRGASMYRGVTRHHQHGRWQARIGRVAGNKDLYLGTFSTQEEAAEAYDIAAIKFRGINAVTNFNINKYDVEKIMACNTLLPGDQAKRNKLESMESTNYSTITNNGNTPEWKMVVEPSCCTESLDPEPETLGSYGNPNSFSLALQDLVGLKTTASSTRPRPRPIGEDSTKLGSAHFSNASSLVTSLNSSREGSPDWNPLAQLRPVFAAWGDSDT